jgi:hypothetical protein
MNTESEFKVGKVDNVEFTHGGAGNQWTTIDGVRYATFWDLRVLNVQTGMHVLYRPYKAKLWSDTETDTQFAELRRFDPEQEAA